MYHMRAHGVHAGMKQDEKPLLTDVSVKREQSGVIHIKVLVIRMEFDPLQTKSGDFLHRFFPVGVFGVHRTEGTKTGGVV